MTARRDAALYLGLAAAWGTAFVATDAALDVVPPVSLAAVRFDVAALALFAVAALLGHSLRPRGRGDWAPILLGGVCNIGLHHALLFAGQRTVPPAVAATLLGLVPVLTPAAARVARADDRLAPRGVAGVLVGFAGVALIAHPDPSNLAASVGVGLVLASAAVWTVGAVLVDEDDAALGGLALQAWTLLVGALALDAAALLLPGQSFDAAAVPLPTVGWVLYLALVPGALGFLVYFRLLDRLGPVEMGLIEYVIPPFAALFGWLLLGETIETATVGGFVAVLAGFCLLKGDVLRRRLRAWADAVLA
ncbi:drug/metabolite transporter (DMT)-like permease [Halarchaeum rubridurum]|uniref:Drug/metabolite transporter (DMT)-like permease n=1 Tax=Halarchaeum rubridurum TaxID=489911 RepID=A0A8T4GS37_9EURY|nr:DMT family transporter [Halarchaeum rubridurum]MBP1954647.1 drug/metabolite transporter (DMT)-like permease [Halarchaeum rubridurum]